MKKQKMIVMLSPYWKEHLEKKGLKVVREQVKIFHSETTQIKKINWLTIISFLTHPYYLSYYVSFVASRRKVLRSFWRFSNALCKMRLAYDQQILTKEEWDNYLTQYLEGTLESENRESKILVWSEVLTLVDH